MSQEQGLIRLFLEHPETKRVGPIKTLQFNILRYFWYALDPGESVEVSLHINGPLTLTLKRFIDSGDNIYDSKGKIIDTQHGVSSPKEITEVDYLKEVLRILDTERRQRQLQAIRDQFSETPDSSDNHLSGDQ